MFPNGYPPLINQPPVLLPNLNNPILTQQMYQRMGRPLPGGLTPMGAQGLMPMGTGGPNPNTNPNSNANIAAALSKASSGGSGEGMNAMGGQG